MRENCRLKLDLNQYFNDLEYIAQSIDNKQDLIKLIEFSHFGPTKVHRNKDIIILMKVLLEKFELLGKELCSL